MFLALGIGAWSGAIFHLVTHAFFKSLLFLGAGVVILAMNHEHDIFAMGGMARKSPFTFWMFLIARLCACRHSPDHGGLLQQGPDPRPGMAVGRRGQGVLGAGDRGGLRHLGLHLPPRVHRVRRHAPGAAAAQARTRGATAHATRARGSGTRRTKNGMQAGAVMGIPAGHPGRALPRRRIPELPHDLGGTPYLLDFLHDGPAAETMPGAPRAHGVDPPDHLRGRLPPGHSRGVAHRPAAAAQRRCAALARGCRVRLPPERLGLRLALRPAARAALHVAGQRSTCGTWWTGSSTAWAACSCSSRGRCAGRRTGGCAGTRPALPAGAVLIVAAVVLL